VPSANVFSQFPEEQSNQEHEQALNAQLENWKAGVKEGWAKFRNSEQENKVSEEKYNFLQKEHEALKQISDRRLEIIQQYRQSPQGQAIDLEQERNKLRDELETQKRIAEKNQKDFEELKRAIASNHPPAPEATPSVVAHQAPAGYVLRAHLESSRKLARQRVNELQQKIVGLEKKIEELEDATYEDTLAEKDREIDDLQELVAELRESADLEKQQLEHIRAGSVDRASVESALNQKEAVIDHLTAQVKTLQAKVEGLTAEGTHLQAQFNCQNYTKNDLEEQVKKLKDTISQTEQRDQAQTEDLHVRIQELSSYQEQVTKLNHTISQAEEKHDAEIKDLNAQIGELSSRAQTTQHQAEVQTASLNSQLTDLNTQLAEKKTENGRLQQQIRQLGQVAENHVQGAQGDASQFKKQYEHYRRQATELQQEVEQLNLTLKDYEGQARAHVCIPAAVHDTPAQTPVFSFSNIRSESTAPVNPPLSQGAPAATTDYTWWPSEIDDLDAGFKKLSLDTNDAYHNPTVIYRHAPASAAVAISFTTSTSPPPLLATPSSSPPKNASTSAPPLLATPSSSTPKKASAAPSPPPSPPPTPYDAREDVPDIDNWWYDREHFKQTWQPATYQYRRTRPFCDNCRTRRALRLVKGKWKRPAEFYRRLPCPEHAKPWCAPGRNPVWQKSCWKEDCADCIETDARVSGDEGQLPKRLREKYRCCGPNCADGSDRIQAKSRFVLAEVKRFEDEDVAALFLHQQNLEKYRAVYGRHWPAFKGEECPRNFAYGAVSYGRRGNAQ
jgi:hypothetical protein